MRKNHKATVSAPISFSAPAALFSLLLALLLAPGARGQFNVLTDNYNNARTNANLNETILNPLNVNATEFGKLFALPVNGFINAQPLYVQNVAIPGKGTHNVVYVVTLHNDVYAFDADAQADSLWHLHLGTPVPGVDYKVDDLVEIGILSTPVIDTTTNTIYLVAHTKESGKYIYRLHALDISTGEEKFGGPSVIEAVVPSTDGQDGTGKFHFDASQHLQRPGLLLLNNAVYIGFGSHSDAGAFHGWLMGYNAANVQEQISAFLTSASGWGAGIWQGGRAPAADDQGYIYVGTGNGSYDGTVNWGESFLKMDMSSGNATVLDWFTPDNWQSLDDLDNDLGSSGPVLTSSGRLVGGGKEGIVYLIDRANMGHSQTGNGQILQSFQAIGFGIYSVAFWERPGSSILYVRGYNDAVKAFRMVNGRFETKPFTQAGFTSGLCYDGMAVSANGAAQFSAILWVASTQNSNDDGPGTLHAFSAANLSNELWNSNMNHVRDGFGNLAKFTAPTVANGKVYLPTFSNRLVVYGLLSKKAAVGDVVNSASNLSGAIAPQELVVVYGSGLGPAQLAGAQVDSASRLGNNLAGTQVLINNSPAALIYARADQVAAIVPKTVAGQQNVGVQVKYQGQTTATFSVPVADTAPGLYTMDQSGQGQGAILNLDSSVNGPANPAPRGSIVMLWGTGQGLTNPDSPEDELASDPLPEPVSPVTVTIGGQKADVLYAGAAPGFAGLIQINARVPTNIHAGKAVPVVVKIGNASSQAGVTLAVQ